MPHLRTLEIPLVKDNPPSSAALKSIVPQIEKLIITGEITCVENELLAACTLVPPQILEVFPH